MKIAILACVVEAAACAAETHWVFGLVWAALAVSLGLLVDCDRRCGQ